MQSDVSIEPVEERDPDAARVQFADASYKR